MSTRPRARAPSPARAPDVTGGWLRPAVFGAMDGLVSNFALIAGVAGGTRRHAHAVVLAGLAGPGRRRLLDGGGRVHLGGLSQAELPRPRSTVERARDRRTPKAEQRELAADVRRPRASTRTWRAGRPSSCSATPRPPLRGARPRGARRRPARPALADARRGLVVRVLRARARCSRCCPTCWAPPRCCRRWCSPWLALFVCGAVVTRLTAGPGGTAASAAALGGAAARPSPTASARRRRTSAPVSHSHRSCSTVSRCGCRSDGPPWPATLRWSTTAWANAVPRPVCPRRGTDALWSPGCIADDAGVPHALVTRRPRACTTPATSTTPAASRSSPTCTGAASHDIVAQGPDRAAQPRPPRRHRRRARTPATARAS